MIPLMRDMPISISGLPKKSLTELRPQIIFSYGCTKSGSTFCFEIIRTALEHAGCKQVKLEENDHRIKRRINFASHLSFEQIARIEERVFELGYPIVIKTHTRPDPAIIDVINRGNASVVATHRDPRDMALSMLDHGARSRRDGKAPFAEIKTLDDARKNIRGQFDSLAQWLYRKNALAIYFNDLTREPYIAARHIFGHLGIEAPPRRVVDYVLENRFIQKNKGVQARFKSEMPLKTRRVFNLEFAPYYTHLVKNRRQLPQSLDQTLREGTLLFRPDKELALV